MHLQETKEYFNGKNVSPIIIGDLNILDPNVIKDVLGGAFECSYDIEGYVSFPSKNEVLDYIVVPKNQYKLSNIKCNYDDSSDHRVLIADVNIL